MAELRGMGMDIQAITKRLYAIGDAILEKTGETPWIMPKLTIVDGGCSINVYRAYDGSRSYIIGDAKGDTPEVALDAADAIIAALPAPEIAKLHAHMARVADCIDKAHADGIADEYVTPLRVTVKAMSDNLLTVRAAE
jgi:hypothetical protein